MKASTALFASVVAICCTVSFVSGQVRFADGSEQTTAYTGKSTVPPGDAFRHYTYSTVVGIARLQLSDTVPAGRELVVLQVLTHSANYSYNVLSSRLPIPNDDTDPIPLVNCGAPAGTVEGSMKTYNYPDGTVVVDEGRQLWWEYYWLPDPISPTLTNFSVLGYYRDK